MNTYTYPKDRPDYKEAAANRKQHDALFKTREQRLRLLAQAKWLESVASARRLE